MKKIALGLIIATAMGCSASSIAATNGEGQINFTGEIIDSACQVVNSASAPLSVTLGKVSRTAFTGVGSTAAETRFDIQLSDCPDTVTEASINFGGKPDTTNSDVLSLNAGTSTAEGVGIQLLDSSDQPVGLFSTSKQYPLQPGTTVNDLQFTARYIQTSDTITAGEANSASTFTVVYN